MKNTHPLVNIIKNSLIMLPTPSSISYLWNWGSILGLSIVIQLATGIFLSTHYNSNVKEAFNSLIHINRDTNYGYELRFIHINRARIFFICIFIHIRRNLIISSFKLKYTWIRGVIILLTLIATAFLGYVLPWGQISFWGATVITNLLSAIPYLGVNLVEWLWGGFSIGNSTLTRFFSLHFIIPFILITLIILHLMSLHIKGSNKPLGTKPNTDKIPFHPFFSIKDFTPIFIVILIVIVISTFYPFKIGDPENFNLANPLNTPIHIQPEWYFLFAYAILRSIPNKLGGVVALIISILILTPLLLIKKIKSSKKLIPNIKLSFWLIRTIFLCLTWAGAKPVEKPFEIIRKTLRVIYFIFLLYN